MHRQTRGSELSASGRNTPVDAGKWAAIPRPAVSARTSIHAVCSAANRTAILRWFYQHALNSCARPCGCLATMSAGYGLLTHHKLPLVTKTNTFSDYEYRCASAPPPQCPAKVCRTANKTGGASNNSHQKQQQIPTGHYLWCTTLTMNPPGWITLLNPCQTHSPHRCCCAHHQHDNTVERSLLTKCPYIPVHGTNRYADAHTSTPWTSHGWIPLLNPCQAHTIRTISATAHCPYIKSTVLHILRAHPAHTSPTPPLTVDTPQQQLNPAAATASASATHPDTAHTPATHHTARSSLTQAAAAASASAAH